MSSVTVAPPNAVLLVFDPDNKSAVLPSQLHGELVAATPSCVAIGTQADVDGETVVSLDVGDTVSATLHPVFSGSIATPNGRLAIVTSHLRRILEIEVLAKVVTVTVGADDRRNPGRVEVLVSVDRRDK
jgi:predicted thioredoxin/glutaredoxin